MGKHSRAVNSIVIHVFVGFIIQHNIISVNVFLFTQLLWRTIIIWNEITKVKEDLPISFSASDKQVPSNIPRSVKST